jgi:hypothetical protein
VKAARDRIDAEIADPEVFMVLQHTLADYEEPLDLGCASRENGGIVPINQFWLLTSY